VGTRGDGELCIIRHLFCHVYIIPDEGLGVKGYFVFFIVGHSGHARLTHPVPPHYLGGHTG
jgi:hypothetical protein